MKWTACKPMVPACCVFLASQLLAQASPVILVPANATWKYLADGSDPGLAWKDRDFNDSGWPSGTAQLGYGDGDEATVIGYGSDPLARHITTYFRKTIVAPPGLFDVTLRILRDDGAVVYVNGVEVFRNNMPAGAVTYNTLATVAVGGADESAYFQASIPPSSFLPGTNLVAVEVHQVNQTSSDLSFALELLANSPAPGPLVQVEAVDAEGREISPLIDIPEDPAVFRITRTGSTENLLGVFLRWSGTANNGTDYAQVTNFVVIPTGRNSTDVVVSVLDDKLFEGTETVVATIVPSPCLECYSTGTNSTAVAYVLDDEPTNTPPVVVFSYPTDGSVFNNPTNILLQVEARDPEDGEQVSVEFYTGTTRLGTGTHVPAVCVTTPCPNYLFEWANPPPGGHTLTARVTDKAGATVVTGPVQISVRESGTGTNLVLVPTGSFWKYWDHGTDQGTAWRALEFNDSFWAMGLAQLGYGDGDEATVVSFGPNATEKYITTYFRRTFNVSDASAVSNLVVRLLRDDGAVVYLNGVEVFRSNMPDGPISYQTLAVASVGGPDESTLFHPAEISPALLVNGLNVIAVELHQASAVSSDTSFDLELVGRVGSRLPERTVVQVAAIDSEARESAPLASVNPGRFAILRAGNLDSPIAVSFNMTGSASNGVDYNFISNRVVIAAGSTQALVTIFPLEDGVAEGTETVVLTIEPPVCVALASPPPGCYLVGPSNQATVFIQESVLPTNQAPSVVIRYPAEGAVYTAPADIPLQVFAQDVENGTNLKVQFFEGTNSLGFATFAPTACPAVDCPNFVLVWSNAPVGSHTLTAKATDAAGAVAVSAPVHITVQSVEPPWEREMHGIGLYSGNYHGGASPNHERGDAWVTVNRPGKRVTLFLSGHEPVLWHVSTEGETVIEKVILGGYHPQEVGSVPPGVPVVRQYYSQEPTFSDYINIGTSIETFQFLRAMTRLCALTGMDLASFQGTYTAPASAMVINQKQNDPELRCNYPQPVDASELPELSFGMAFYDDSSGSVFHRGYTLAGATNGGRLLPGLRMVTDAGGLRYYGNDSSEVWLKEPDRGLQRMELGPGVPLLSWPTGIAFDSQRNRVLLSSLGSEGFLYAYSPTEKVWSLVHDLDNRDVNGIVYHPADDSIYAVTATYEDYPTRAVLRYNAAGQYQGQIVLPQMPLNFSFSEHETELVSVGAYLVLLIEPNYRYTYASLRESRMYLIDPRTSQVWLTYRKLLLADSDDDGVPDGQDQCPNSPRGAVVDANGCTASQRDSDGDGVLNSQDVCPNTEAGAEVNGQGCGIAQLCPCEGPWRNHNEYVTCVRTSVEQFVAAGWMTAARGDAVVEAARVSNCGRRRPRLRIPPQPNGAIQAVGCQLILEGDGPGVCVIECSNDLNQWRPISTNTLTGVDIPITDAEASGAPKRFYRIREE